MQIIRQCFLAACAMAAASQALAHSVWIEPSKGQLVIRFAEPDGTLEKSPGHLDNLTSPIAFRLDVQAPATNAPSEPAADEAAKSGAMAPVAIEAPKKSNHFLLMDATPANTVCAETSFTVRAERKPKFYARWQPAGAGAATPLLTLDIVPTGKAGEARAYFRGKPLGGVKATLHAPDASETELTTDAEGFLHFTADQPGQYLLTIAHHREPLAGYHLGVAYKETSHNAALTWSQPAADSDKKKS